MTRLLQCAITISLTLALVVLGESDELSDLKKRLVTVEQHLKHIQNGREHMDYRLYVAEVHIYGGGQVNCTHNYTAPVHYITQTGEVCFDIADYKTPGYRPGAWMPFSLPNEAAIDVVDDYFCTDERDQAIAYATRDVNAAAVPDLWDGRPFAVDISSTFPNAFELLDVVGEEAERIREILGYEIFVAGNVLTLPDIQRHDLRAHSRHQLIPPDRRIEIRCCSEKFSSIAGTAFPWLRVVILKRDAIQSRHIIMHELYHILGLAHPDQPYSGIAMSHQLNRGGEGTWYEFDGVETERWKPTPARATAYDIARLSCIYSN